MKKKRYIGIREVQEEILECNKYINLLKEDIERVELRRKYLFVLQEFLYNGGLCSCLKADVLKNDLELEFYALPLLQKEKLEKLEEKFNKNCR